jgi:hypothetical protein
MWVVSFTPRPLYPQGKSPWKPLDRRPGGPQSRSWSGGEDKNSQPPPEIEPKNPDRPTRSPSRSYEGVSKRFRAESITKYTLTTINTRWESTETVMEAELTRLTHKISIQWHLVAESCTILSSRSRRPVRKLFDTPSCSSTPPIRLHGVVLS